MEALEDPQEELLAVPHGCASPWLLTGPHSLSTGLVSPPPFLMAIFKFFPKFAVSFGVLLSCTSSPTRAAHENYRYHSEWHPSPFTFRRKKSRYELRRHILSPHFIAFHAGVHISLTFLSFPASFLCFSLLASHPDPKNKSGGLDFITWKTTNLQTHVKYQLFITSPYAAELVLTVAAKASAQKSQKEISQVPVSHADQPGTRSSGTSEVI